MSDWAGVDEIGASVRGKRLPRTEEISEYPHQGTFVTGAKTLLQRGESFFVRLPLRHSE